jgi:hypothetical protein
LRLRKKSRRVWRTGYTALRLRDIPQVSCSVLCVHSTYSFGMGLVSADLTAKLQGMAIIPAYMIASRACLRSISRIYVDYSDSSFLSLVFNEGLKLSELPARMLVPELFRNVPKFSQRKPSERASPIFRMHVLLVILHQPLKP